MRTSTLTKFVEFLLDNLFDILTILVAAGLVIRYTLTAPTQADLPILVNWGLGLLGLIAVSGLWDRNRRMSRIEKLAEETRDLTQRSLSGRVRAGDFFLTEPRVPAKAFASAQKIDIAGVTLARTTREFLHPLGQRLVAGAHIRIIIVDPDTDTALMEASRKSIGAAEVAPEFVRVRLQQSAGIIAAIANTPGSTGKLEVGYLPYVPAFGLFMIEPDQPAGHCFVEMYHHKTAEANPTFQLHKEDDDQWFGYFKRQYETLWASCRKESLPRSG